MGLVHNRIDVLINRLFNVNFMTSDFHNMLFNVRKS